MFKLVIQDDEGKITTVTIERDHDEITIGRKEGNSIRLTERNVSRRHARILHKNSEITIEDLGSYNGIRVNNARIAERVRLRVTDQVQIGDYKLFLQAVAPQAVDDAKTVPIERVETATTVDSIAPLASPPPGAMPSAVQFVGNANRTLVAIADTDPAGRPIATPAVLNQIAPPVGHARLVVLSSNFAGSEFELSRSQMIIGRTNENDIVINHRSISRNHAKLVREPDTGRYTVSDLQSSNGVRVNNQDYGKVELRRGDVIDLGHVRMRFVEPGEEYVFTRDAIEDVPEEGRGRGLWVAIALAALVLGGVGLYFAFGRGDGHPVTPPNNNNGTVIVPATPDASIAIETPADAAVVAVIEPDAAVVVAPPDAAPPDAGVNLSEDQVKRKRSECAQAQGEERWADLKTCAATLRLLKGTTQDDVDAASAFAKQALIEIEAKRQLDRFTAAQRSNNMSTMAQIARNFKSTSMYAQQVREKWDREKASFVSASVDKARSAARRGRCGDLRSISNSIRSYDSGKADEVLLLPCSAPKPSVDCKDPEVASEAARQYQELMEKRLTESSDKVIRMAEQAVNNPCIGSAEKRVLIQIGVVAACTLKRVDKLKFFTEKAPGTDFTASCPGMLVEP